MTVSSMDAFASRCKLLSNHARGRDVQVQGGGGFSTGQIYTS